MYFSVQLILTKTLENNGIVHFIVILVRFLRWDFLHSVSFVFSALNGHRCFLLQYVQANSVIT
jgi:hypothetical protein